MKYKPRSREKISHGQKLVLVVSVVILIFILLILPNVYDHYRNIKKDAFIKENIYNSTLNLSIEKDNTSDIKYGDQIIVDISKDAKEINLRGLSDIYDPQSFFSQTDEIFEVRTVNK